MDVLLALGAIAYAVTAIASRRLARWGTLVLLPVLVVGGVAQWIVEGFYWQFVPTYVLVCAATGLVVAQRDRGPQTRWRRRAVVVARGGVGILVVVAGIAWLLVPVPNLPRPTGPYAVGTEVFRLVDPQRPETATDSADDHRNVVVQAWYPADPAVSGTPSTYLDGLDRLPKQVLILPACLMRGYGRIDTHGQTGVPVSADRARWPVVVFSPGYGAPRGFYTGLIADLASRGVVVLAVDHPYEVAVTELADGTIATQQQRFLDDDPDQSRYMSAQLDVRTADLRFVVDQLGRPGGFGARLSDRLDTEHVAAIGHSFGGAAAAAALASDPRLTAAANIDGTLYGTLPQQALTKPFLLLESDHSETGHSAQYLDGNRALLDRLRAPGFRYEIAEANHYSFTDAPRFLADPARHLVAQFIGGSRGPRQTQRATNDILMAFLQDPLGIGHGDIAAAAAKYRDIHGGPVR
ncbi:alpha/beta hydrolase family protein [Nocardia sp. NPDC049149]|uniref:alpha/beta hydrolase family protein n=1 Tax=Nocardia sp. NPDC049149 TaxID=3364315 RepID=UPI003719FAA4